MANEKGADAQEKPAYGEASMSRRHTPEGPKTKVTTGTARGTRSGTQRTGTQ